MSGPAVAAGQPLLPPSSQRELLTRPGTPREPGSSDNRDNDLILRSSDVLAPDEACRHCFDSWRSRNPSLAGQPVLHEPKPAARKRVACVAEGRHSHDTAYLVLGRLGEGTFGQVVRVRPLVPPPATGTPPLPGAAAVASGDPPAAAAAVPAAAAAEPQQPPPPNYACKVVKNLPAFTNQAELEVHILRLLNHDWDPTARARIVRLHDWFVHQQHLCLVFELLGPSLLDVIRKNQHRGLRMRFVHGIVRQLLLSLDLLKLAGVIHSDIKPENVLLKPNGAPEEVRLIDFGSACFANRTVYTYLQSRFYRSPEVILGCPYGFPIDMWSLGCLVGELAVGLPLFPGVNQHNQLSRIIELCGPPPDQMLMRATRASSFFYLAPADHPILRRQVPQEEAPENSPEPPQTGLPRRKPGSAPTVVPPRHVFKTIEQYCADENVELFENKRYLRCSSLEDLLLSYPLAKGFSPAEKQAEMKSRVLLLDLLRRILRWSPDQRLTPHQALQHPFITDCPAVQVAAELPSPAAPLQPREARESRGSSRSSSRATSRRSSAAADHHGVAPSFPNAAATTMAAGLPATVPDVGEVPTATAAACAVSRRPASPVPLLSGVRPLSPKATRPAAAPEAQPLGAGQPSNRHRSSSYSHAPHYQFVFAGSQALQLAPQLQVGLPAALGVGGGGGLLHPGLPGPRQLLSDPQQQQPSQAQPQPLLSQQPGTMPGRTSQLPRPDAGPCLQMPQPSLQADLSQPQPLPPLLPLRQVYMQQQMQAADDVSSSASSRRPSAAQPLSGLISSASSSGASVLGGPAGASETPPLTPSGSWGATLGHLAPSGYSPAIPAMASPLLRRPAQRASILQSQHPSHPEGGADSNSSPPAHVFWPISASPLLLQGGRPNAPGPPQHAQPAQLYQLFQIGASGQPEQVGTAVALLSPEGIPQFLPLPPQAVTFGAPPASPSSGGPGAPQSPWAGPNPTWGAAAAPPQAPMVVVPNHSALPPAAAEGHPPQLPPPPAGRPMAAGQPVSPISPIAAHAFSQRQAHFGLWPAQPVVPHHQQPQLPQPQSPSQPHQQQQLAHQTPQPAQVPPYPLPVAQRQISWQQAQILQQQLAAVQLQSGGGAGQAADLARPAASRGRSVSYAPPPSRPSRADRHAAAAANQHQPLLPTPQHYAGLAAAVPGSSRERRQRQRLQAAEREDAASWDPFFNSDE